MNHKYASELPAHYLKHWGLLVDTGAHVSVAPKHFAPEVPLEPVPHPAQLLTATSRSMLWDKDSTTGYWKAFFPCSLLHHRRKADPTGTTGHTTRRHTVDSTRHSFVDNPEG